MLVGGGLFIAAHSLVSYLLSELRLVVMLQDDLAPSEPDVVTLELREFLKVSATKSKMKTSRLRAIQSRFQATGVPMMSQAKGVHMASHILPNAIAESRKLVATHSGDSRVLLNQHLKDVAANADPVLCANYQLQMPSMDGYGAIAVPHVFLEQMYRLSASFGYALGRAKQAKNMDYMLSGQSWPLESYMCSDLPSKGAMYGALAQHVVAERAQELFGNREELVRQVETVFESAGTSAEIQVLLVRAMRASEIDMVFLTKTHLHRISLEAVAFGRYLWDADT